MNRIGKTGISLILSLFLAFTIFHFSESNVVGASSIAVSVVLDETTKTMYSGQSARLTYLPANASVTWLSTNPSVVTVDATGKVTAKNTGTSVIILRTPEGGFLTYCTITVISTASSVKLDVSELKLKTGEYYYLQTTLTPKDSTYDNLIWESSDTKIATVDKGKVVAKNAGSAIIIARTEAGGLAFCKVNIIEPVKSILLNFSEKTMYTNNKFKLEVSVTPSSSTTLGVAWKSSNTNVASVTDKGEVSGLSGGTAIITCTSVDGGFSASCVVTVREPVTKIALEYDNYYIGIGKTFKLNATVTNETATNQKVKWTTSNKKVATVNQYGKVTGKKAGYATITAMALDGSEVEASCEVRIVTPAESITINDNYISMFIGDTSKLKATIKPKNATYKNAVWTTSDPTVAIVDDNGVITALKEGAVTITASTRENNGKKAICQVMVYDRISSTGITLQDKKLAMVAGEEKIVQKVLAPENSTDRCTWSTDNPAVAIVDKKTGKIKAKATGTAFITVMTNSGKTASVEVSVIGLNLTEIVLEEYTNYTSKLEVEGVTTPVKWSISNPLVAVVNNGYVSSRGTGKATITALVNGRKLTCKLTVIKQK